MELHHAMTTLAAALSVSGCHRFKTKRWVTSMRRVIRLLQMVLLVMLARSGSLVWTITTQAQVISSYPWPHTSTPMGLLMVCIWIRPENGGHTPQRINLFFLVGKVRFWHVKPCHVLFPQNLHQIWTDGFAIPAPPRQDQAPKPVWWPSGGAGVVYCRTQIFWWNQ